MNPTRFPPHPLGRRLNRLTVALSVAALGLTLAALMRL